MLARLLGAVAGVVGRAEAQPQPARLPPEAQDFAPMVPLHPPAAHNDEGMHRVCEAVETALREAGHLS